MHTQCTVQVFSFPSYLSGSLVLISAKIKIKNLRVIRNATFLFLLHTWKCIGKLISSHSPPPNLQDVRSVNPEGLFQHLIILIAREWIDFRWIMLLCSLRFVAQNCDLTESVPYDSVWYIVFVLPWWIRYNMIC